MIPPSFQVLLLNEKLAWYEIQVLSGFLGFKHIVRTSHYEEGMRKEKNKTKQN